MFTLFITSLSSFFTALMIVTDRFIVNDYYNGRSDHAWFITSIAGSIFDLALTAAVWFGFSFFSADITLFDILDHLINSFFGDGIIMFVAGLLSIQWLFHYFKCYENDASSSNISAWIAATPIFTLGLYILVELLFPSADNLSSFSYNWFLGILIACIGLITLELLSGAKARGKSYYWDLFFGIGASIAYTILLHYVFAKTQNHSQTAIISLLPYYWLGFAGAARLLIGKKFRREFVSAWAARIHIFILPIIIVEIIGMLIFYFEYFGLVEFHPALVGIIIGANVILVYIIDFALGLLRGKMDLAGITSKRILGFTLTAEALPEPKNDPKKIFFEIFLLLTIIGGIILAL